MLLPSTVFGSPPNPNPLFVRSHCHSHHLLRVAISGLRTSVASLRLLPVPAVVQHVLGPDWSGPVGPTDSESSSFGNIQLLSHKLCNFA